ncbi:MAG: ParA family protein [Gammaproteobacteria bacterium]
MRHIMVLNPKGGCGKSTIATNLASYFASEDKQVAIADFDPQESSLDWLARRPEQKAPIAGAAAYEDGFKHLPRNLDVVIVDAPARSHGKELTNLLHHAETIIIPVMPSSIDMQATAKFIDEVMATPTMKNKKAKIAVVANRIRAGTLSFDELDEYLNNLKVPYIATLREAQNYVRAYTRGLGIHELPDYIAWPDKEEWGPLIDWLDSRSSKPVKR